MHKKRRAGTFPSAGILSGTRARLSRFQLNDLITYRISNPFAAGEPEDVA